MFDTRCYHELPSRSMALQDYVPGQNQSRIIIPELCVRVQVAIVGLPSDSFREDIRRLVCVPISGGRGEYLSPSSLLTVC